MARPPNPLPPLRMRQRTLANVRIGCIEIASPLKTGSDRTMQTLDFAQANRGKFLGELKELLRIPSISTLPENADDIRHAAEWLAAKLKAIGLTTVEIYETDGYPVVYGTYDGAEN